ncbi:MAG: tyrosine-type recombinase/integrase [bacterium]|nr:tyrosine-type recombinase/integrase [bacterium]
MEAARFTVKSIEALKPRAERYEVREKGRRGLAIRVSPTGTKTWVSIYRFGGRLRRMTHGDFPVIGIEDAHKAHAAVREAVKQNRDPGLEKANIKQAVLLAPTFKDLAGEFFKKENRLRERTKAEYQRILEKDVFPAWERLKAEKITRRHITLLLDKVAARGGIQANRTLAVIRRLFNWAIGEGIFQANPASHVKAPAQENRRDRVLTPTEVARFWEVLEETSMSDPMRRALKLILVTAQRPGEVVNLHWNEVDGDWLTIPAERSKNRIAHRVYLTPLAKELLGDEGNGFVFSRMEKRPFYVDALSKAVRRNRDIFEAVGIAPFTPHDLRRSAGTMISAGGASREILKAILNHVDRDVTAIYDRHGYDNEKKRTLSKLSRQIENLVSGKGESGEVVKLRGA